GVEADAEQASNFSPVCLPQDFVGIDSRARELVGGHAPHLGDVRAVFRVPEIAAAGELVAFLPVLAAALAVALSRDRAVAGSAAADAPGRQHDVDGAEHVVDAARVVLEAARVQEEAALRSSPELGGSTNGALADTGDFRGARGSERADVLPNGVEADGEALDEVVIEPVVLDHQV